MYLVSNLNHSNIIGIGSYGAFFCDLLLYMSGLLTDVCAYMFVLKESQSNHSSQADSGMSDGTSSSHARSQSVVSSIFSEAWKRGTQIEESTKVSHPLVSGKIFLFIWALDKTPQSKGLFTLSLKIWRECSP